MKPGMVVRQIYGNGIAKKLFVKPETPLGIGK